MTKTTEAPTAPRPPDGALTMQVDNQTFILEVLFNPNSKEAFQDKLMRVILAEGMKELKEAE
ncbi:MAG: transposon-encoded TnpW family protein [Defluviitaleaceae bacterium]|nr:transposon-encoded TnpW family protein [Defluviitaleaceae bacterium]